MELLHLLFSFRGRIGRGAFWLGTLFSLVWIALAASAAAALIRAYAAASAAGPPTPWFADEALVTMTVLILLAVCVLFFGALLAVQVKRWRDLGKNWLWVMAGFVPVIGPFWVLIECGVLPGRPKSEPGQNPRKY